LSSEVDRLRLPGWVINSTVGFSSFVLGMNNRQKQLLMCTAARGLLQLEQFTTNVAVFTKIPTAQLA